MSTPQKNAALPRIGILTVSDRASQGVYADQGGPAIQAWFTRALTCAWEPVARVIPDEQAEIEAALIELADVEGCSLIVTTGGTGPAPRDVTPEATAAVCERIAPGIPEAMRAASMAITPHACLSRETAGILGGTLVVNLPGSPKAACENISAVIGPIAHGLRILRGGPADCAAERR